MKSNSVEYGVTLICHGDTNLGSLELAAEVAIAVGYRVEKQAIENSNNLTKTKRKVLQSKMVSIYGSIELEKS